MDGNGNDRNAAPSEENAEARAAARSVAPAAPSEIVAGLIVDELKPNGDRVLVWTE